ncbi:MAG TPA: hypothetical protein VKW04_05760, partial [Planctomycetota bacterium]|nr:hypothetical protein [Planctomycetota bacterium]
MKPAALLSLLLLAQEPRYFDPDVHESTRAFTYDKFLIIPVRVHRLQCKDVTALDCRLQDDDVRRIFEKANRIWNKAGLALAIESITAEAAVHADGFEETRLEDFRGTRPADTRPPGMIHLYYVHQL